MTVPSPSADKAEQARPEWTDGPLRCMFVTDSGQVWANTQNGWCWLREEFYGHGWTWESGYDEPLSPVAPLLDLLGQVDVSRVVAASLLAVRACVDDEISRRSGGVS